MTPPRTGPETGTYQSGFQPGVDQPPRDGERRRQHGVGELVAPEPAHVLELGVARRRLAARVLGEEAKHQRARARPRLRRDVAGRAALDAGLLPHLAGDGLLEALARLDEAGEGAVAARRPLRLAAEHDTLAPIGDEHDHDRVGPRVM